MVNVSFLLLLGPLTSSIALLFVLATYLKARKNLKCAVSRLFLRKEKTAKAFYSLIVGSCFFVINQIFTLLYSLKLVSYMVLFLMSICLGSLFALSLTFTFYEFMVVMDVCVKKPKTV